MQAENSHIWLRRGSRKSSLQSTVWQDNITAGKIVDKSDEMMKFSAWIAKPK